MAEVAEKHSTSKPAAARSTAAKSPHLKLHPIDLSESRWTGGFMGDRFAVTRDSLVPAMGRLMTDTERFRWLGNFETAAGLGEGQRHRGPKWNDGDFYKWLESAAAIYASTKDPALDKLMDACIELVAAAQDPDGYIHTPQQIDRRFGGSQPRFADPMHFEMYNMGHLVSAALVHHRATGKETLLKLAIKAADYMDREFANPTPERARHGICPSHLMALVDLYRHTDERRYLDAAERLLNMRDLVVKGDDDNQDRVKLRDQRTAHGHAVRATYLYAGAADIYAETGDASLMPPLQSIWSDLVDRKLYITGGCGALFDGASPDGSADQLNITRVHQAFGRDYQLPHATAHNETCAAIGNLFWNWRMLLITGESRFADLVEQTLYNSVFAGVSLDGINFFYTNTLRRSDPMPVPLRFAATRKPTLGCYCCPPNVARIMAESAQFAYTRSDRGLNVVLYGTGRLETTLPDGTAVRVEQETAYPNDGRIRLKVLEGSSRAYAIGLRIPGWAKGAKISVNGKSETGEVRTGTFHEIERTWSAGDEIELQLPMAAKLVEANPYVEEARNHVAVVRGPLVYCLESCDLPEGVRLEEVALRPDTKLETVSDDGKLGGTTLLACKAVVRPTAKWAGGLYREVMPTAVREIDVKLVPYFAWDNRGEGEMTVWIPLSH